MPVGLIAGGGNLPALLLQTLKSQGTPVCILALKQATAPELLEGVPHLWISLGEITKALDFFQSHGVSQIVMGGRVPRPALSKLKMDWKGALWAAQFEARFTSGDDALLHFLAEKLESEGFQVIAPQDILHEILGKEGPMTSLIPSPEALEDIKRGVHALKVLSPLDMGQAVVVQQGLFLGVEGVEGTDGLIERCGPLQKDGAPAILVKGAKTKQDLRLDLPALGPETVKKVIQAGFQGIAFEVLRTVILDPQDMAQLAQEAGIFLMGVRFSQIQ